LLQKPPWWLPRRLLVYFIITSFHSSSASLGTSSACILETSRCSWHPINTSQRRMGIPQVQSMTSYIRISAKSLNLSTLRLHVGATAREILLLRVSPSCISVGWYLILGGTRSY
jgi:hypothetical protein